MTAHWDLDVTQWWLANDEGYPHTIKTIRQFVEYRATRPTDASSMGLSQMSGIFRSMNIDEHGFSDDLRSLGGESSTTGESSASPIGGIGAVWEER